MRGLRPVGLVTPEAPAISSRCLASSIVRAFDWRDATPTWTTLASAADPLELPGIELRPRIQKPVLHDIGMRQRQHGAVLRRDLGEMIERHQAAAAQHGLHDHRGLAGDEPADVLRHQLRVAPYSPAVVVPMMIRTVLPA